MPHWRWKQLNSYCLSEHHQVSVCSARKNQFVHAGEWRSSLRVFSALASHCKMNKSLKRSYLDSWRCCCGFYRSYLWWWDRVTEKAKRRDEEQAKGPRVQIKRARDIREKARKCLSSETQAQADRAESSDSGALTQRCHTVKGMCWMWEEVLLTQMTSPSLLKAIG